MTKLRLILLTTTAMAAAPISLPAHAETAPLVVAQARWVELGGHHGERIRT